jgi:hypothetical protein
MHTTREIEACLQRTPPGLRDIVWELRSLIVSAAPAATEVIKRWGLSYYHAGRGGPVSAGICQIGLFRDHVRLGFIHGAFLPDPQGLLEADGEVRYKRYVRLVSFDQTPWNELKDLITASARFDPRTISATVSKP